MLFYSEFGSKVLPIKPFLPKVVPLLEDRDKTVRDEAKLLLVEIYKWIGKQTLMPMIQNVKPIQVESMLCVGRLSDDVPCRCKSYKRSSTSSISMVPINRDKRDFFVHNKI
jgi:hypothetical protein